MSRRRAAGRPPRQTPYRRTYPDGRAVWVARYRDLGGETRYARPSWNGGKSVFARKSDAQAAIDEALEQLYTAGKREPAQIGSYFRSWLAHHPRSQRTNQNYDERIRCLLNVSIEGRVLANWQFDELRRRQVHLLVDHMLRVEGRAAQGVRGIISAYSAMAEDAIGDDAAEVNAFIGVRIRRSDPRIKKPERRIRIWSFEQMREFAAAGRPGIRAETPRPRDRRHCGRYESKQRYYSAHDYEALLLTPALTGLRLGEFLALRRSDIRDGVIALAVSCHEGELVESSRQKNHERTIPIPESLARLYAEIPEDPKSDLLFTTPRGGMWRERNFYRDVWTPAQIASGIDPTPHEFRHSYVTHLRAAGIDDADLAQIAGHRIETMLSVYTHPLARSHAAVREILG